MWLRSWDICSAKNFTGSNTENMQLKNVYFCQDIYVLVKIAVLTWCQMLYFIISASMDRTGYNKQEVDIYHQDVLVVMRAIAPYNFCQDYAVLAKINIFAVSK